MPASVDYAQLLDDLVAEEAALDARVSGLDDAGWHRATPAAGWDVRDTIAHLAIAEELAALALDDPAAFGDHVAALLADLGAAEAAMTARGRSRPGPEILDWWRTDRARVVAALRDRSADDRIPWLTGLMSAASFATARLMETWAHGADVAAALDRPVAPTHRLRHVADLGVRTRAFAYGAHGRARPDEEVRVELRAPDGSWWTWGDATATAVVRGDAFDFCLVVTQRAHLDDTALELSGDAATEWMGIAQAFAGPPSTAERGRRQPRRDVDEP